MDENSQSLANLRQGPPTHPGIIKPIATVLSNGSVPVVVTLPVLQSRGMRDGEGEDKKETQDENYDSDSFIEDEEGLEVSCDDEIRKDMKIKELESIVSKLTKLHEGSAVQVSSMEVSNSLLREEIESLSGENDRLRREVAEKEMSPSNSEEMAALAAQLEASTSNHSREVASLSQRLVDSDRRNEETGIMLAAAIKRAENAEKDMVMLHKKQGRVVQQLGEGEAEIEALRAEGRDLREAIAREAGNTAAQLTAWEAKYAALNAERDFLYESLMAARVELNIATDGSESEVNAALEARVKELVDLNGRMQKDMDEMMIASMLNGIVLSVVEGQAGEQGSLVETLTVELKDRDLKIEQLESFLQSEMATVASNKEFYFMERDAMMESQLVEVEALKAELASVKAEGGEVTATVAHYTSLLSQRDEAVASLEGAVAALREEMGLLEAEKGALSAENGAMKEEMQVMLAKANALETALAEMNMTTNMDGVMREDAESKYLSLCGDYQCAMDQVDQLKREMAALQDQLATERDVNETKLTDAWQSSVDMERDHAIWKKKCFDEIQEYRVEIDTLRKKVASLSEVVSQKSEGERKLHGDILGLRREVAAANDRAGADRLEANHLRDELADTERALESLKNELILARQEVMERGSAASESDVLKSIAHLQEENAELQSKIRFMVDASSTGDVGDSAGEAVVMVSKLKADNTRLRENEESLKKYLVLFKERTDEKVLKLKESISEYESREIEYENELRFLDDIVVKVGNVMPSLMDAAVAEGSSSHDLLHTLQVLDNEIRASKRVEEEEEEEGMDD